MKLESMGTKVVSPSSSGRRRAALTSKGWVAGIAVTTWEVRRERRRESHKSSWKKGQSAK
jgi:hypothetical protein